MKSMVRRNEMELSGYFAMRMGSLRWRMVIVFAMALLFFAARPDRTYAADIHVPCTQNSNFASILQGAAATSEPDTIHLEAQCTYSDQYNSFLFYLASEITINGNNAILALASNTFRGAGSITLNNITLKLGGSSGNSRSLVAIENGVTAIFNNVKVEGSDGQSIRGIHNSGQLTLNSSHVTGFRMGTEGNQIPNPLNNGGGIYNTGNLTINKSTIANNVGINGGGGIYNNGTLIIRDSQVVENRSETHGGGGIYSDTNGNLQIERSTIANNVVRSDLRDASGGGIYSAGELHIQSSTVSNNRAANQSGGGIYIKLQVTTIENSTIVGNTAASGGGIDSSSGYPINLKHTIIAENKNDSTSINDSDCAGYVNLIGPSLIQSTSGCSLSGAVDALITGEDPQLGPLQNNGGPTQTHMPAEDSPVVNAGQASADELASTDQRGLPRFFGGRVDLGAVELNLACMVSLDNGTTISKGEDIGVIRSAIEEASPGATLKIAGTCKAPTDIILGTRSGYLQVNKDITLQGGFSQDNWETSDPETNPTILDGLNKGRLLWTDTNSDVTLTVDGLQLINGRAGNGAGIYFGGESLTIRNSILRNHRSSEKGGAIHVEAATLTIEDSQFYDNQSDGTGGSIHFSGDEFTLAQSLIRNNQAHQGGGIYLQSGKLTLSRSTIRNNTSRADGGGLFIAAGFQVELEAEAEVEIAASAIYQNEAAGSGGGIYNAGTLSVANSTLGNNEAIDSGGGLYNMAAATFEFSTLAENNAPNGANLYQSSEDETISLFATIVTQPGAGENNCVVEEGDQSFASLGYNRVSDNSCGLTEGSDEESAVILLKPLNQATFTYLPIRDATNAILDVIPLRGSDSCESALGNTPVDQRGGARPLIGYDGSSALCDVGAMEVGLETLYVCGPPLSASNPAEKDRCTYPTVSEAFAEAVEGDTIVISGVVQDTVVLDKDITLRGPNAEEITPGTHMGFLQAATDPPTDTSAETGPVVTIQTNATVTIRDLHLRYGKGEAGGLLNQGNATLIGVTIYENRSVGVAQPGAAIVNGGEMQLINSTITQNWGEAIVTNNESMTILNSTISTNDGVAIFNQAHNSFSIDNSIVAAEGNGKTCDASFPNLAEERINLVSDGGCGAPSPSGLIVDVPALGPLRDNGGPTLTMAPAASSPAANGPATCATAGFPTADQRGRARPASLPDDAIGPRCTIGAVQSTPQRLVVCENCNAEPDAGRFTDLQAALNRSMAGDTIAIEAGIYTGNFIVYKDVTLEHAGINVELLNRAESTDVRAILQASPLGIREQLTLPDLSGSVLRIEGYRPSNRSIESSSDLQVTLNGLTIRHGRSRQGGGIHNRGDLRIIRSTLSDNVAVNGYDPESEEIVVLTNQEATGGAIYNAGDLRIERSTLSNNRSEFYGGAIYNDGAARPNRDAIVEIVASTLANNLSSRIGNQHMLLMDNDLVRGTPPQFLLPNGSPLSALSPAPTEIPSQTISSGDEVLIHNRLSFEVVLNVSSGSCNQNQVVAPPSSITRTPLICTAEDAPKTVTLASSQYEDLVINLQVTPLGFEPEAHILYQTGESSTYANFGQTLLISDAPSNQNCSRRDTAIFSSSGYNVADDDSCLLDKPTDLTAADPAYRDPELGPLQDNNWIDFEAETVSGFTYMHALMPNSPAIDVIPAAHCASTAQIDLAIVNGQTTIGETTIPTDSISIAAGDIVVWSSDQAVTIVMNDGHYNARQIAIPAGGQSEQIHFAEPGQVAYRVYNSETRAGLGEATITVAEALTTVDQRGLSLPQRGTQDQYRCDVGAYEFQPFVVGQPILRPPSAIGSSAPKWEIGGESIDGASPAYHIWSPATSRDFPLHPSANNADGDLLDDEMVTLVWTTNADPQRLTTMQQMGIVEWPDAPQLHVSGANVNLGHLEVGDDFLISDASAFEGRIPEDEAAGTILSSNVFNRTILNELEGDSYSVLTFVKDAQSNATVQVQVVKSVEWNAPGVRDIRPEALGCVIGTPLSYSLTDASGLSVSHQDPEGKAGKILLGNAFDGVKDESSLTIAPNTVDGAVPPIHVRETRAGDIIPILEEAPTNFGTTDPLNGNHDLRVAWYRPDDRNVAWPMKTVGYRCDWPQNLPQIVIASELGSEIDNQSQLDPQIYVEPAVYHQADPQQPGYSPNFEHALLADSNLGSGVPTLYALRTDLRDRNPEVAGIQSYAFIKYRDGQNANKPRIGVYEIQLTRPAASISATDADVSLDLGAIPSSGEASIPVRLTSEQKIQRATVEISYPSNQLLPTHCSPNRSRFVETPTNLQIFSDSPQPPGRVVHFQATLNAGTNVRYQWNFGDGTVRTAGSRVSHVYRDAGQFTVRAQVVGAASLLSTAALIEINENSTPGTLTPTQTDGCHITSSDTNTSTLTLDFQSHNKHGLSGEQILADITFTPVGDASLDEVLKTLQPLTTELVGPDYETLRYDVTAGNPVFAPVPLRNLLDVQSCEQTTVYDIPNAKPFWKDSKGNLWARAAGAMQVLYYYPMQPGFYFDNSQRPAVGLDDTPIDQWVGHCVPWLHNAPQEQTLAVENEDGTPDAGANAAGIDGVGVNAARVYPVDYEVRWPDLAPVLVVGDTIYERTKNGISGVAQQLAVSKIYDDEAPGQWMDNAIVVQGSETTETLAQLIDPIGELRVPLNIEIDENPALPAEVRTKRLLFGGGQAILGSADHTVELPFALRSRIAFDDLNGELIFRGYYDGASAAYIKGDPLLLLNVMTESDKKRLQSLCLTADGATSKSENCTIFNEAIEELYYLSRNPRSLDLCRNSDGQLWPGGSSDENDPPDTQNDVRCLDENNDPVPAWRDGKPDRDFLIGVQDANNDGWPEPFSGLGKGKALSAGNATDTGFVTLAYNNDASLNSLPVSLQVIQVGCTQNVDGEDSTYRGNLLAVESDNLFDEKLTIRHTGDFGGQPDNFEFEWYIAPVDDTGVSPVVQPPAYPWSQWTKLELGADALGPEITIEGANPTTLRDNWLLMRYKGYTACGNQNYFSAYAGDPSAKPSEVRAQLAQGWIKRVTNALNPFDARVDDFVSAPVNTTVDMISQAGPRYEGPIPFSNDPETLNGIGLIEAYQTILDRGRSLSIDSNINDQGANAALLNVTSRIADLYMLLANDAYVDALDPTVTIGSDVELTAPPTALYAFMNQFRSDNFGPIDEELALLRGRDETLGGVAAAPTYNRLTWNFTNGQGEVAYQQNYNIQDYNEDGFIDEADAAVRYPQGHGDAWGHMLTAMQGYYNLLRHSHYTWSPRAEPISVAGAPVVVDYYDERRFAIAAAAKAQLGAEVVDLTYRKHYAEATSQAYVDSQIDPSDGQNRAWGVSDWAVRAGQGAYVDWVVANAILPPEEDRFYDVRKVDRSTVVELQEIVESYQAIQQQLDDADNNVNPLGLATDVVLFDLDAGQVSEGETHFEQVYQRALTHLDITHSFLRHANETKRALRDAQNEEIDFVHTIIDADTSLVNELIELFGYPYDADIGVNGTYPDGYKGPDIYNYDLYDRNELTDHQKRCHEEDVGQPGHCEAETTTHLIAYEPLQCIGNYVEYLQSGSNQLTVEELCPEVDVDDSDIVTITYQVGIGLDAGRGRFKPSAWPEGGGRKAVGDIQNAIQDLTQARLDYEQAIVLYEDHIERMVSQQKAIKDKIEVIGYEEDARLGLMATFRIIDGIVLGAKQVAIIMDNTSEDAKALASSTAECPPTSVGFSNDFASVARCAIELSGAIGTVAMGKAKLAATISENVYGFTKETTIEGVEFELTKRSNDFEIRQMGREISGMFREERQLRLNLFLAKDQVNSAQGTYDQTLQRAFRKLHTLSRLRKRWAGQVSGQRYNDMAYRTVQNSSLQTYRRQFDLTQLYVYITAAAYDYETNLGSGDAAVGQNFLREVVGMRNLGHVVHQLRPDGTVIPLSGLGGLAEPLAQMHDNFSVLKGQMGFNNPQPEVKTFSLRRELFRLTDESDVKWQQELQRFYTPNIYANDDVSRLAKRPYGGEAVQPGLIIPFSTSIFDGQNFFGQPLGTGDNAYNATQFATKIQRAGIYLEGYDGQSRLSNAPQVYLIPAGYDVLRPRNSEGELRYWSVREQFLPLPHVIGQAELENSTWIPRIDGLDGQLYATKQFPRLNAFSYTDELEADANNTTSQLIGRSVWNTQWLLVIPGQTLLADPELGLERFMEDVEDIKVYFETYSYAGGGE